MSENPTDLNAAVMDRDLALEIWGQEDATPEGGWWAVLDRCDDDAGPYPPVALFARRADADAYVAASHPDDITTPLVFQGCVTPAMVRPDGGVIVSNDFFIDNHEALQAKLDRMARGIEG